MNLQQPAQSVAPAWWLLPTLLIVVVISYSEAQLACPHLLDEYLQVHHREAKAYTDDNQMVYFLHVPRTAGRTFHSCMLKLGTVPGRRCPKAYDHLRLNMTVPNCYLLSSHDDFSVVSMLPDNVAVLTHLRDPVDRFLSAYEFAVEVGSRAVNRPQNFRKRPDKIATEDVWPWSYLVPFFTQDVRMRMTKLKAEPQPETGHWIFVRHPDGDEYYYNKVKGVSKWNITDEERQLLLPALNAYDNPMVMSLTEFIRHPASKELLHNGQTFQVLGITNYSHWGDAYNMRDCFWKDAITQEHLLDKAKARIQKFIHVGVTDRLADSVAAAATAMKFTLDGPAYGGGDDDAVAPVNTRKQVLASAPATVTASGDGHDQQHKDGQGHVVQSVRSTVEATDLPDLAEKVREARTKLQLAQRQLFHASQHVADDSVLLSLKSKVGNLRVELRDLQDTLLEARSKLHTATDPSTPGKKAAEQATTQGNPNKKLGAPLGIEYQRCANRAQARNLQRRDNSLAVLAMPGDGRTLVYGKEARKLIPPEVIEEIRQLNLGDTALHKLGTEILNTHRKAWREEGRLQDLPALPPMRSIPKPPVKFPIPKPQDSSPPSDEL